MHNVGVVGIWERCSFFFEIWGRVRVFAEGFAKFWRAQDLHKMTAMLHAKIVVCLCWARCLMVARLGCMYSLDRI